MFKAWDLETKARINWTKTEEAFKKQKKEGLLNHNKRGKIAKYGHWKRRLEYALVFHEKGQHGMIISSDGQDD